MANLAYVLDVFDLPQYCYYCGEEGSYTMVPELSSLMKPYAVKVSHWECDRCKAEYRQTSGDVDDV